MKHSPIWWIGQCLLVINDENLPIINKTKHLTRGEKKVQDEKMQVMAKEKSSKKGWLMETNQVFEPPFIMKNISYNEREGTYKITFSLEEPSFIIITCFEIETAYACCNATNTFYL